MRDPVCTCECGCRCASEVAAHLVPVRSGGNRDNVDAIWNHIDLLAGMCQACHDACEIHEPGHAYSAKAMGRALQRLRSLTDADLGKVPRSAVQAAIALLEQS